MVEALQILLSGPGLIGSAHLAKIRERQDCVIAGIVAPPCAGHSDFARSIGAAFYSTVERALASQKFDGAIISSPNNFHHAQAIACIDARVPALVEKPLTDDVVTAKAIVAAVERTGVPILVGHHRSHSPLLKCARDFLLASEFGRLVAVQGSALFYKPATYFADGPWRSLPGGGPAMINLIHEIGVMRYLCGEIESVSAFSSNAVRSFPVEDTVAISLRFVNGALGTFVLSDVAASTKSWEMTSGENSAYPFYGEEYAYHFAGTNGSLDFPSMRTRTYSGDEPASWWRAFDVGQLEVHRTDPLREQISHFVDILKGRATPIVSAQDGYNNMLVVDAILRSAREQRAAKVLQ